MNALIDGNKAIEALSIAYRKSIDEESKLMNMINKHEKMLKNHDISHREYSSVQLTCEIDKESLKAQKHYSRGLSHARELMFELLKETDKE